MVWKAFTDVYRLFSTNQYDFEAGIPYQYQAAISCVLERLSHTDHTDDLPKRMDSTISQ